MFSTPWSQKTVAQRLATIGIMIGIFAGSIFLAYAISNFFTYGSFKIPNTRGTAFTMDLNKTVSEIAALPGSEQSVTTSIKNTGTEKMYVFVRFNTSTTSSGGPIYSFAANGWSAVDRDYAGELLFVYGSEAEPTPIYPGETASLSGTLTVVATGADFVSLTDDDFGVDVTGCCVGGPESSGTAAALYSEYLSLGGH